jgi:hypothetical protein
MYRRDDTDIIIEEKLAIENRDMVLAGSKAIALIVLFDPDEESVMDVLLQVYNTDTEQYEGEEEEEGPGCFNGLYMLHESSGGSTLQLLQLA